MYHILDCVQQKTKFTMEQPYMLPIPYFVNNMAADALATSGARTSADMVFTK